MCRHITGSLHASLVCSVSKQFARQGNIFIQILLKYEVGLELFRVQIQKLQSVVSPDSKRHTTLAKILCSVIWHS
jgi:hypothetical protein